MAEEAEVAQRSSQVQQLLTKKDKAGALAVALTNPPVNSKSEELKVSVFKVVRLCGIS